MHLERVVDVFLELARQLYYHGSNATEIEKYISDAALAYNLEVQIASIGTVIYLTVVDKKGKSITRIERIQNTSIDFNKLEQWENLIKKMISETPPISFVRDDILILKYEQNKIIRSMPINIIAVFIASFSFSFVFKGGFFEGIASGIVGTIVYLLTMRIKNKIFKDFMAGFLLHTLIKILSLYYSINPFPTLAGAVMVFVPGLLLTNGIMEIGDRNLVSGSSKLLEAIFVLGALVMGAGISAAFWR
ncbi:threonine/serine exporter family protein [Oceanotoga sp. DSM 15011]|uniref:threonine/serine ThrE exporter family protein n=1 Tax=Oceanotoga sp. DSM 15011 TaxID=2984951 RepID=UPI0021F439D9|nr:threonine/serine exporter family protein [Oceanotoga sp. DSM 15011]UYO99522.1 threonine/serine exporter family protein [Oceanotoga sp. DSM 15011]